MKSFVKLILCILTTVITANAQEIKTIKAIETGGENIYTKSESEMWQKAIGNYINNIYNSLSKEDKGMIDKLEMLEGPFTQGPGCSWYCGGGPSEITTSSILPSKDSLYASYNIHDFNLLTAWIPNTKEEVIGAKINFHFEPHSPRVTTIKIYNGYIKNYDLWKKNARVKKLKLYVNNNPIAILELEDTTAEQTFKFEPLNPKSETENIISLEIIEVYKGTKYKDVAISEINFDGLDVHCFAAGTKITLPNNKTKNIEDIINGERILTYNENNDSLEEAEVTQVVQAYHNNLVEIKFGDKSITTTNDHPFFIKNKGWASLNPTKSNSDYIQDTPVKQIELNDYIYIPENNGYLQITQINPVTQPQVTYTLEITKGSSFIANGALVKTETVISAN